MRTRPLVWKLFPAFFLITSVSIIAVGIYASASLRDFYYSQAEEDLEVSANLIRQQVRENLLDPDAERINATLAFLGGESDMRITLISPTGEVIADSRHDASSMESHADRPEFKDAMLGEVGTSHRRSPTLGVMMVYVAVPVMDDGDVIGVLRTSRAATALDASMGSVGYRIVLGAILAAVFASLASYLAVRRISGPLAGMRKTAKMLASGDFGARMPHQDTEEFAALSESLDQMASQLHAQLRRISRQASEREAILVSMREGVLAVDNEDCVLIVNPIAEQLLGVAADEIRGKTIQEAIRNPELQDFLARSKGSAILTTEEMICLGARERVVEVTGTTLRDADGKSIGVLAILDDVTETRKLESMRKDFVANVSHELKTPITSIKGYVETLRDGTVSDASKMEDFLDTVARQADRLNSIIDDLLSLSRIERDTESRSIVLQPSLVKDVLVAAASNCGIKAQQQDVKMSVECDDDLEAPMNAHLIEQAVTNLVDNAIKHSSGGSVVIRAELQQDEVAISVEDTGSGIEPEHIPRLFERFYRVDKARSRKMGGTGLGLAIVKHIAQAHRARVEVESTVGKGSVFSIHLPCVAQID